jgi:hypothetical protein
MTSLNKILKSSATIYFFFGYEDNSQNARQAGDFASSSFHTLLNYILVILVD